MMGVAHPDTRTGCLRHEHSCSFELAVQLAALSNVGYLIIHPRVPSILRQFSISSCLINNQFRLWNCKCAHQAPFEQVRWFVDDPYTRHFGNRISFRATNVADCVDTPVFG